MQEHDSSPALMFHPSARPVVYFGPFRMDLADGSLTRSGEEVRLPPRALAILQHLVERAGRIVSKQSLMDVAWKDAHVSETSLTEAVGLIRQALADNPQQPEFIQTVHRRGYRFIAAITTDAPAAIPIVQAERTSHASLFAIVAGVALLIAAGAWLALVRSPAATDQVVRVNVAFPSAQAPLPSLNAHPIVALAPDGQRFVYVGGPAGNSRLFVREMDRFDAVALPGTEGAHGPFFSPDGEWVAFFAQGHLKKARVSRNDRSAPQVLCATDTGVGGTWVSEHEIVFAPNWRGALMRVPATGGQPAPLTLPAGATYRWPDRLDDHTILATRWRSSAEDAAVVALSLSSGAERVIATPATFGRYTRNGYVVFLREGDLYSIAFNPSQHRPQGSPVRVIPTVMTGLTGAAQFAVSPAGSLLYVEDIPERSYRTLAATSGRDTSSDLPIPARAFSTFATCGDRLAAAAFARGQSELWAGHLDRAAMTQLTRDGAAFEPIWSPDCRTIAFAWNRTGVENIYTVGLESGDAPRPLFESPFSNTPGSWSADGRWLAYTERHPQTSGDIWLWDRATGHRRPLVTTPGLELLPVLSPDAKYVAYESSTDGQFEVEVASIETGARARVSVDGGIWPAWTDEGHGLFFLHDTSVMRAEVGVRDGQIVASDPVPVFSDPNIVMFRRAGDRFVWLKRTSAASPLTRMNLVLNWFSELDRGTP
jgi:serine/threonine-protein kinase